MWKSVCVLGLLVCVRVGMYVLCAYWPVTQLGGTGERLLVDLNNGKLIKLRQSGILVKNCCLWCYFWAFCCWEICASVGRAFVQEVLGSDFVSLIHSLSIYWVLLFARHWGNSHEQSGRRLLSLGSFISWVGRQEISTETSKTCSMPNRGALWCGGQ